MSEKTINVNYIIDDKLITLPTKLLYEKSSNPNAKKYSLVLEYSDFKISSEIKSNIEFAVVYLQRALPKNINIVCCQSCGHGNYCPYGDNANEIFCFKDVVFKDKFSVCQMFEGHIPEDRKRKLLDYCPSYKPITNDFYTYNDWLYSISKKNR